MSTRAAAVLDIVRDLGLDCDDLVPLRSTNNTVFLLDELGMVAKVHDSETAAAREGDAGRALANAGAPVVPPASGLGEQVHSTAGVYVTFWEYVPDASSDGLSSTAVAVAMHDLHSHLVVLADDLVVDRILAEQLVAAMRALHDETFAPLLGEGDRRLLARVLDRTLRECGEWPSAVVHGSPHRLNILDCHGAPVFIDLETIQTGPVEWDLAHLEPEVADAYPEGHDEDRLAACRTAVSAVTATWCWGGLQKGPDMRSHAEHHLAVVRAVA